MQRIYIAIGFVGLVALVVLLGYLVFYAQQIAPTIYSTEFTLPDAAVLIAGVDGPVTMIFSLTLGLFVLAGFALKDLTPAQRLSGFSVFACGLFLFGSMVSIYMGVSAKTVALYYASFKTQSAISLTGTFTIVQLVGVAISGLAAVLLLAERFGTSGKGSKAP